MAIPTWQPGRLYQPGDIVLPVTAPSPTAAQVENGDFSAGNVNWDFTGGAEYSATGGYGNKGPCVLMPGSVPEGLALNKSVLVLPQTASSFEASAMIQQGASIAGATRGWVEVRWFDADGVLMDSQRGNIVSDGSGGAWHKSSLTAVRPAGAAYARAGIGLFSVADHSHEIFADNLVVSGTFAGLPDGLVYKAVQQESGFSANTEPVWPPILGQTVVDNDVIWEAVASTRVTWEASPLYVSGDTEPEWPTDIGGFVRDGTINWKAVSRRVEDVNCPDSKIVAIAASKVFAGDDDIVRYSATVNPLDWTTSEDAGYLPTGLQNYGANPVAAMGLYRGNLAVFNAEGFQLWQVDEDPASMALIDALPLGSTEHRSVAPVANDLVFATRLGIRSLGVSASSTNYQAGDIGAPIDTLVQEAMRSSALNDSAALAAYHPAAGQYLLSFANYPPRLSISGGVPDGVVGMSGQGRYTVAGGLPPYGAVSVQSGALPPGVLLNGDGTYSYTFSQAGSYAWAVGVSDDAGAAAQVDDTCEVTDPDTWVVRTFGGPAAVLRGKYKLGAWEQLGNFPDVPPMYLSYSPGVLHTAGPSNPPYAYSTDNGSSWTIPAITGTVSAGAGRMLTRGGYLFLCAGVDPLKRRVLPAGALSEPSSSELSRANTIVSHGASILVASIYSDVVSASSDLGVSWSARGAYRESISGAPILCSVGSVLVVMYTAGLADGSKCTIKRSVNGGVTWAAPAFTFPDESNNSDPAELVHDGQYFIAVTKVGQVARSRDGISWTLVEGISLPNVVQIAVGDRMLMATCDTNGIKYSQDSGLTWSDRPMTTGALSAVGVAWIPPGGA